MMLLALAAMLATAGAPAFEERPCRDARLAGVARCGEVRVSEDRSRPDGRRIALNVVVLPAPAPGAKLPPLFDLDGGPGLPATKNAGFYLSFGGAYRAGRDVVLVDQRGTGASNPLTCPDMAAAQAAAGAMYPPAAVARCREALSAKADLTQYGTNAVVADLDAVRAALGHETIDIFALSYGTTAALRYMATHPGRVRAAVLMGTAPVDAMPPRLHAAVANKALTALFAGCAADAACRTAFPSPADDLDRAARALPEGDARDAFVEKLRTLMYRPATARQIPFILRRAADGDLAPYKAATGGNAASMIADGVYLSITCGESFALMDYGAAAKASRATRFGDYRLRRQRAACAEWPAAKTAPDHLAPPTTDAAVLLISGGLDPATPPEWADEVARRLPNARHLVIRQGGHVLDGLSGVDTCFDPLVVRFFETADPKDVDAACLARMEPPPFQTAPAKD